MEILTIEKALSKEAQEIINFLNDVGGETDFLTFGLNEFPISLKEETAIINECLQKENSLMLVGKINKIIVSQLFIEISKVPRLKHIGYLGLSVKKSHWRQSIGEKMLTEAITWSEKKKLVKIQLQVRTDNLAAINLYKKFGFVIEGTITYALKINHEFYDDFLMSLNFI